MSDTPAPVPTKAKASQAKADSSALPSIRMVKDVDGSDQPVAIYVREDQVSARAKDGFKRDEA